MAKEHIVESFRVKPNAGRFYVVVMVFPTLLHLRRHAYRKIREEKITYEKGYFEAVFFGGVAPCLGEVMFSKTRLHPGIVTHELTHAAMQWARRTGIDPTDDGSNVGPDQEERFVSGLDTMVRQFFRKYGTIEED